MLAFEFTSLMENKLIFSEPKGKKKSLILLIHIFQQASIFIIINEYPAMIAKFSFLLVIRKAWDSNGRILSLSKKAGRFKLATQGT